MNFLFLGASIFFAVSSFGWFHSKTDSTKEKGFTMSMCVVNAFAAGYTLDIYIRHLMK